jgi:hypothetical protein
MLFQESFLTGSHKEYRVLCVQTNTRISLRTFFLKDASSLHLINETFYFDTLHITSNFASTNILSYIIFGVNLDTSKNNNSLL